MNDKLNKEILEISIDDIVPNRFQPRLTFDEEALQELANSIREHGIIQPLVVRRLENKFELIAGERRYKASTLIGLKKVPCIVMDLNDSESAEVAIIENIQRKEMSPLEEAKSYKKLLDKGYLTQEQLAKRMGKTQSTIANKLRLLNLDELVQDAILNGKISERHARSMLRLQSKDEQREILAKIIEDRLTVRQTDELIKDKLGISASNKESNLESETMIDNNKITEANNNMFEENSIFKNNSLNQNSEEPVLNSIFKTMEQPKIDEKNEIHEMNQKTMSTPNINLFNEPDSNPQMRLINSLGNQNHDVVQDFSSNTKISNDYQDSSLDIFKFDSKNNISNQNSNINDINNILNPLVFSSQTSSNMSNNNFSTNNTLPLNNSHNSFINADQDNDIFLDIPVRNSSNNVKNEIYSKISDLKMLGNNITTEERDLGNKYEIIIRIDK